VVARGAAVGGGGGVTCGRLRGSPHGRWTLTVHLVSESRASDASLIALADAVKVAEGVRHWLIVGGHMVNLHILRAGLDVAVRATRDADLGVDLRTLRASGLVGRLRLLGYDNPVYSNRFDRTV